MTDKGIIWDRHQGDEDDTIVVGCDGVNSLATATTVVAWVALGLADPVELAATITDPTAREVTVELGDSAGWLATAAIADWRFTIELEFQSGAGPLTWPEKGHNTIRVHGPV